MAAAALSSTLKPVALPATAIATDAKADAKPAGAAATGVDVAAKPAGAVGAPTKSSESVGAVAGGCSGQAKGIYDSVWNQSSLVVNAGDDGGSGNAWGLTASGTPANAGEIRKVTDTASAMCIFPNGMPRLTIKFTGQGTTTLNTSFNGYLLDRSNPKFFYQFVGTFLSAGQGKQFNIVTPPIVINETRDFNLWFAFFATTPKAQVTLSNTHFELSFTPAHK